MNPIFFATIEGFFNALPPMIPWYMSATCKNTGDGWSRYAVILTFQDQNAGTVSVCLITSDDLFHPTPQERKSATAKAEKIKNAVMDLAASYGSPTLHHGLIGYNESAVQLSAWGKCLKGIE